MTIREVRRKRGRAATWNSSFFFLFLFSTNSKYVWCLDLDCGRAGFATNPVGIGAFGSNCDLGMRRCLSFGPPTMACGFFFFSLPILNFDDQRNIVIVRSVRCLPDSESEEARALLDSAVRGDNPRSGMITLIVPRKRRTRAAGNSKCCTKRAIQRNLWADQRCSFARLVTSIAVRGA